MRQKRCPAEESDDSSLKFAYVLDSLSGILLLASESVPHQICTVRGRERFVVPSLMTPVAQNVGVTVAYVAWLNEIEVKDLLLWCSMRMMLSKI